MTSRPILGVAASLVTTLAVTCGPATVPGPAPDAAAAESHGPRGAAERRHYDVLVFSRTEGFRHSSIPVGIRTIRRLGRNHGFSVTATENPARFTRAHLARYEAVVWLSTTGDVLGPRQQRAFERYIRRGGGYVGVHAASDTEYRWPWYGRLVGAYFQDHPEQQTATVQVLRRRNPATRGLPRRWERFDEWYNFRATPRSVRVLARLDESTYDPGPGGMGEDHPIAWWHRFDGGRAFYTGLGHTEASYRQPRFRSHLLGGIELVAGRDRARATAGRVRIAAPPTQTPAAGGGSDLQEESP